MQLIFACINGSVCKYYLPVSRSAHAFLLLTAVSKLSRSDAGLYVTLCLEWLPRLTVTRSKWDLEELVLSGELH